MKRFFLGLAALLVVAGGIAGAQNVLNYQEQGGSRWAVGGTLDIVSGGQLQIAGTDRTAALATAPAAVASGYKIARGETALDGSNPTDIASGLTSIVACAASIKATAAPGSGDGTRVITYTTSSATLSLYGWAPTSGTDPTLVASSGTETVGWVCVGT